MRVAGRQVEVFSPQKCDDLIEIYRRTGRPEDFEQIVRRFAALVLSETRRVTRNPHDAEDASQLTFLALAMEIKSGTDILRVGPWLQRVSRRQALKIVRSRGRRQRREDKVRKSEMHLVDADKPLDQAVAAGIIRDAIDKLPDRYRLPVVLHYFGGMTLEMIAAEMKITRQTVGTRLHRGRKMLATKLSKQGVKLDSMLLASAMSLLVPAAVVEAVMRSAGAIHAPAGTAALPAAITQMLRTVSFSAAQKPLRIAIILAALACGGRGMAWAVHANWSSLLKPTQAMQWLHRALRFHPQWNFSFSQNATPSPNASSYPIIAQSLAAENQLETLSDSLLSDSPFANDPVAKSKTAPPTAIHAIAKSNPVPTSTEQKDLFASAGPFHVESFAPISGSFVTAASAVPTHPISPGATPPAKIQAAAALHDSVISPAPSSLILGTQSTSGPIDRLQLGAGTHQFSSIDVGESGRAELAIADAATVTAPQMRVGVQPGSSGTVTQHGGKVDVTKLTVGDGGAADYYVDDNGEIAVSDLLVANQSQSVAQFDIASGKVDITTPQGYVTIGNQGKGSLLVGSVASAGNIYSDAPSVPLVVRDQPQAEGLILGWGAVGTGGTLVNNGRVVADGYNQVRTLNLTNFSTVQNTIDNPPNGNNGWFVQRGGRITLPPFQITPSQQTYTWGESSDDPTLDLVNSLRMTVQGQKTPATVSMTLRTATAADPLSVPMPTDVILISLWQINSQHFDPSQIDYAVRYDASAANIFTIDGRSVDLFAYTPAGQWESADNTWIDPADRIVGGDFGEGDFPGSITYLAVGVAYTSTFAPQSMTPMINASFLHSTITPEPSSLAFLLLGTACLLKRSHSGRWSQQRLR